MFLKDKSAGNKCIAPIPQVEQETKKFASTARAPAIHSLTYEGRGGGRAYGTQSKTETQEGLMIALLWKGGLGK